MTLRIRLLVLPALLSPLAVLLAPLPVAAEALPQATLQILDDELVPGAAAVEGQQFLIHNRASAAARVEFDLPRGEGLVCETPGDLPRRARKFVVAAGAALSCASESPALEFEVSRAVRLASGRYQHQRDTGRIDFPDLP